MGSTADKIKGYANQAAGKVKESIGRATGSGKTETRGNVNETAVVHLLQLSLSEEENADQLLNQLVRPLMSSAKMPEAII